jgi:conjugative transposon TraM protein
VRRKFLLVLPILSLPFLTLIFWLLGGGTQAAAEPGTSSTKGLNMSLPMASLHDESRLNKLSFYEKASIDSSRSLELPTAFPIDSITQRKYQIPGSTIGSAYSLSLNDQDISRKLGAGESSNEQQIYSRLADLDKAINVHKEPVYEHPPGKKASSAIVKPKIVSEDVDRLEGLMNMMNTKESPEDPEMKKLNEMLDKIVRIQNPNFAIETDSVSPTRTGINSSLKLSLRHNQGNEQSLQSAGLNFTAGQTNYTRSSSTFYSLEAETNEAVNENAIPVEIDETVSVVHGSTIKMRTLDEMYAGNKTIPVGTAIFGIANLTEERLKIIITSIKLDHSILPVAATVFDLDGIEGIYVPGSTSRDVAKSSADQALQGLSVIGLDRTVASQATAAGIQTAKTLLSKRAKLIRVTLKQGYRVLLKS